MSHLLGRSDSVIRTAVDFHCGCGGFSVALVEAGIRVLAGFDEEESNRETYDANLGQRGCRAHDLADMDAILADLGRRSDGEGVDLVVGRIPTVGFSSPARHSQGPGVNLSAAALLRSLDPLAFIFAAHPHAMGRRRSESSQLMEDAALLGYDVNLAKMKPEEYGAAHLGSSCFVFGTKNGATFEIPAPMNREDPKPASSVLDELPEPGSAEALHVPNHVPVRRFEGRTEVFDELGPGESDDRRRFRRLQADRPAPRPKLDIGAGLVHHRHDRLISVREAARLVGFSDEFAWPSSVPVRRQYQQVGSSVSPVLASVLVVQLLRQFAQIEAAAPDEAGENRVAVFAPVAPIAVAPAEDDQASSDEARGSGWLAGLKDDGHRRALRHIELHGHLTEGEAVRVMGGGRAARRFACSIERYSAIAPFTIRVEPGPHGKTWVRE